jgi:hypothetical protein
MSHPRYAYLAIILIVVIAGVAGTYAYVLPSLFSSHPVQRTGSVHMTIIHIHKNSNVPPQGWSDILGLSSPGFRYPFNFTVVIGVNNTIEWINDDTWEHTVIALTVPQGTQLFDSGFIGQGQTFTQTLAVPGVYKYDCAWHPWLAGVITVKPA